MKTHHSEASKECMPKPVRDEHHNEVNITLLDHRPEVVDSVGHGPLSSDVEPLTLPHRSRYVAGIDIAKLVVFVTEYLDTVLIIRNNIFKP